MLQHRKAPGEPFPIAIAIGVDPRLVMAASCPFPFGVDELAMAGAIRGKPFEVVNCKTVPLQVPADAELVLEGFLKPDEKQEEGPFRRIHRPLRRPEDATPDHSIDRA